MKNTVFTDKIRVWNILSALVCLSFASAAQAASGADITVTGARMKTLSMSQTAAADKAATHGAVSSAGKALTFHAKTVRLVVRSGPSNDMLSYRIAGLRNPTLIVPAGATLGALFINTDDDMTHNLRFTAQTPPFDPVMRTVGTSDLPHKSATAYHAEEVTVRVPAHAGTYTYLCTIPGHAPGGMQGKLIAR